jgi:hypothetical protein
VSKNKRNRLITGRKGALNEPCPDMWIDERGIEWLLCTITDLARGVSVSPIEYAVAADDLVEQGLIERRTFKIKGRERTGWRIKYAAVNFKLAMVLEERFGRPQQ